jgi:DNA-binding response OmpR family regulator
MATRRELNLKTRVLVIDENRETCELLEAHLAREGITVHFAHDGKSGLTQGLSGEHDFVILDLKLPQLAGLEVTKQLRAHSTVGILILSDRSDKVDNIIGLEFGADDYLIKPFNPSELLARIRAISRRRTPWLVRESGLTPEHMEVDDLCLDGGSRTCRRKAELIDLTTVEFDLLTVFLCCSGRILHRKDLLKKVSDREYCPFDRSIDVHVCNLRRKLGPLPDGTKRIRGVRRVGYVYVRATPSDAGISETPVGFNERFSSRTKNALLEESAH